MFYKANARKKQPFQKITMEAGEREKINNVLSKNFSEEKPLKVTILQRTPKNQSLHS